MWTSQSSIWNPMESFVCWKATKHAFGVILLLCFCCFNFMLADKYCGIRHLLIWSATQWTQQSLLLLRFLRKQEPMTRKGCLVWLPLMLLGPRHSMLERPRCQLQVCPITHLRPLCFLFPTFISLPKAKLKEKCINDITCYLSFFLV